MDSDFIRFAAAHGVMIRRLIADGRIHRCGTSEHPRSTDGAYRFDGTFGFVQAWDQHDSIISYKPDRPMTPEEAIRYRRQVTADRDEREREYAEAAERARMILQRCTYGSHRYLVQKGFRDANGLIDPKTVMFQVDDDVVEPEIGCMVVPMRHFRTGDLQSIQWIAESGRKKYLAGGRAWGAAFSIGASQARAVAVEGFATGKTVYEALASLYRRERVVVCFSSANLKHVAPQLGPDTIVFADHDALDKRGRRAGQEAAQATGLPWTMSPVEKEDADDLRQRAGIRAVAELLRGVL